jgi:hypothetical protein
VSTHVRNFETPHGPIRRSRLLQQNRPRSDITLMHPPLTATSHRPSPANQQLSSGDPSRWSDRTACASPPAGRARWTLKLLADAMVDLTESLSHETAPA